MVIQARSGHLRVLVAVLLVLPIVLGVFLFANSMESPTRKRYREYLKQYDSLKTAYLEEKHSLAHKDPDGQKTRKALLDLNHKFEADHGALRVRFGLPAQKPLSEDSEWGWGKGKAPGE